MVRGNVLCLFGAPDRISTRAAIARCIGLIQRRYAVSLTEIAKAAGCDPDTIENANKERTTLGSELLAALQYHFDDDACWEPWERLCRPEATPELSVEERLERIEREASAIRKEIAR